MTEKHLHRLATLYGCHVVHTTSYIHLHSPSYAEERVIRASELAGKTPTDIIGLLTDLSGGKQFATFWTKGASS